MVLQWLTDWPLISPCGSGSPPELQSHSYWSRAPCLPSPPLARCDGPADRQTQQLMHVSIMWQPLKQFTLHPCCDFYTKETANAAENRESCHVEDSIIKTWFDNNTHWLLLMAARCNCLKLCGVQYFTILSCLATHLVCGCFYQIKGWETYKTSLESSSRSQLIRRWFQFHSYV